MHDAWRKRMSLAFGVTALVTAATACTSRLPDVPANVSVGGSAPSPAAWPTPRVAPNDARPEIQAMHFSTLDIRRGSVWTGQFVVPTNVASVEVRTNLFSIDVPRTSFGRFAFTLDVLDTPPIFIRPYRLRVVARNSSGATTEEDLPLDIR